MKKTVIIFMLIAFAKLTVAGLVPWGLWQTAGDELPTEVGLYHLETNMLDEISETYGYTSGIYTNDCKVGDYAAYFNGSTVANTVNSTLLNGKTNVTISAWVKIHSWPQNGGLIYSRWSEWGCSGWDTQASTHKIRFQDNAAYRCYAIVDSGTWYFIVVTFAGGVESRMYVNGELKDTGDASATFHQADVFRLAYDDEISTRKSHCSIDEIGLWDTCLTSNQQYNLYIQLGGE